MTAGTSSPRWQPARRCRINTPHHHIGATGHFFRCISRTKGDGLCPYCETGRQRFGGKP